LFRSGFFLCFVRFFAVVDSSQRAAIVPGFVVDSSPLYSLPILTFAGGRVFSDDACGAASPDGAFTV
jgi:hypothetical protein